MAEVEGRVDHIRLVETSMGGVLLKGIVYPLVDMGEETSDEMVVYQAEHFAPADWNTIVGTVAEKEAEGRKLAEELGIPFVFNPSSAIVSEV